MFRNIEIIKLGMKKKKPNYDFYANNANGKSRQQTRTVDYVSQGW